MGIGWVGPAQTSWITDLMPAGREAELWGLVTFSQISLTWLPPIPFFLLNQWLGDMRLGIASLVAFFIAAACIALTITERSLLPCPLDEPLAWPEPSEPSEHSPARAEDGDEEQRWVPPAATGSALNGGASDSTAKPALAEPAAPLRRVSTSASGSSGGAENPACYSSCHSHPASAAPALAATSLF